MKTVLIVDDHADMRRLLSISAGSDFHVLEAEDGHDIDCKIEGFGAMRLKSEFVRKA